MKGKQLIPAVLASVLIGAALGGPATAAVAASAAVATSAALTAVTASPSTQTFYVDGEQVDLEAYVINGRNYVQLRDVGRAAGFAVAVFAKTPGLELAGVEFIPVEDTTRLSYGVAYMADELTPLIFVTNMAQYAVSGYEVNAVDFIVKPVEYYNFYKRRLYRPFLPGV